MVELDLENMTDDELYDLVGQAESILAQRQTRGVFEEKVAAVFRQGRESGIVETPEQGETWRQPHGAHDSYAKDDVVTHEGRTWISTVTPNVWIPGQSGWREVIEDDPETGEPQYPAYNPPTGAHDAYNTGERITWEGQVYEATQDAVVWSPSEYPPAWQLVEDEPEEGDEPEEPVEDEGDQLPPWQPDGHQYYVGDQFDHEGTPYRVLQDHKSQPHHTPDLVPALYEKGQYAEG